MTIVNLSIPSFSVFSVLLPILFSNGLIPEHLYIYVYLLFINCDLCVMACPNVLNDFDWIILKSMQ